MRSLAAAAQLPNRARPDSQGICFLGHVRFPEFVQHHLGTMQVRPLWHSGCDRLRSLACCVCSMRRHMCTMGHNLLRARNTAGLGTAFACPNVSQAV